MDRLDHTATADRRVAGRPAFGSGPPTKRGFSVIAPRRPGAYRYTCLVHGFMTGVLVVRR